MKPPNATQDRRKLTHDPRGSQLSSPRPWAALAILVTAYFLARPIESMIFFPILHLSGRQVIEHETMVPAAWQVPTAEDLLAAAMQSFSGFFQQRLCAYPDTRQVLTTLRERGLSVGVLTDVPYGMPATFVRDDLRQVSIEGLVDVLLTSVEVGWRKPAATGFVTLAERLGTSVDRMLFVGNEAKDVLGAGRAGARGVFLDHERRASRHG